MSVKIRIGMSDTNNGANIILVKDGKILLLLRSGKNRWKPNRWGPPGGHIDLGEDAIQAAVRETFEETGLTVKGVDLELLIQKIKPDFGRVYFYITDKFSDRGIKLSHEHDGFTWVDMKKIDEYDTTFEPEELDKIKKAILSY